MSSSPFKDLAEELCALLGLDEPQRLMDGEPLDINGIRFSLTFSEEADLLYIYVDFGLAPPERKAQIYELLLEANTELYPAGFPAFTVSPDTKHVVLACPVPLDGVTAESLHEMLGAFASHAEEWNKHHFLDTPGAKPAFRHPALNR
jgi:hypothetical protein